MASVKGRRPYSSSSRTEQARQTRVAVIDAAENLFLTDGLTTTIAAVAAQAGVSVETIYKAFGGKHGLVRAICQRALAGDGPVPAEQRSDDLQSREQDPREIIRGWGVLTTEVAPRVAPILLLVRAAAITEPDMADLKVELDNNRLTRMRHNARSLADGGHLRPGLTADQAAEVLWTYSSPEMYELLVLIRGWPLKRYGAFIADAMIAALLQLPPTDRAGDEKPALGPAPRSHGPANP